MEQIRWHGRGGQGAVTAAKVLGLAASIYEGNYAQSFPAFGTERRGAPVLAFTRVAQSPIRDRSQVDFPDYVVVLDGTLLKTVDVAQGLKPGGQIVLNLPEVPRDFAVPEGVTVTTINATKLALDILTVPIVNTAMAGAFCAVTGLVQLDSLKKAIEQDFPVNLIEKNIRVAETAYQKAQESKKTSLGNGRSKYGT